MLALKEIQPKLQEIQKKYKDNPQEYQRRVLEVYKEKGVNPFGGCLPLLIQFPFLIALFQVLRTYTFEGVDPNFLIWTLTEPDRFYILPILSGVTTYFMSILTVERSFAEDAPLHHAGLHHMDFDQLSVGARPLLGGQQPLLHRAAVCADEKRTRG